MRLVITRPQIDAVPLANKLEALGHSAVMASVLDIIPRRGVSIPHLPYQAICATSANGVRCLIAPINYDAPIFTVGEQSAAAARAKGFQHVDAEGGDVEGLVRQVVKQLKVNDGPLLYLSGADTSGDLAGQLTKQGFDVTRLITYDAVKCALDNHASAIALSDGVLLYSPRTAKLWSHEIERLQLSDVAEKLRHFCLSPAVAQSLPQNWRKFVAKTPTEKSLLALLDLASEAE